MQQSPWKQYDEAAEYFDKKDWIKARVSYFKAIDAFLAAGMPDNGDDIGEARLNIAYTYYNERNYKKSKEILLEIQRKNPNYEPLLIKETLEKVNKLI